MRTASASILDGRCRTDNVKNKHVFLETVRAQAVWAVFFSLKPTRLKKMRYQSTLSLLLAVACASVFLSSCTKDYESPLTGSIADQTLGATEGFRDLEISSENLYHCVATTTADWCMAFVNNTTLRIVVGDNKTYEERTATVTVKDEKDGASVTFKVIQLQNDAIIAEKYEYDISDEGGLITIPFKSNVKYEVQSMVGWIGPGTRGATRAMQDYTVELYVYPNDTEADREGQVIIKDPDNGAVCTVTVRQSFTYALNLSTDFIPCDENGGEFSVTVESNFNYRFETQDTWIQDGGRTSMGDNKYTQVIKVPALPAGADSRRGYIYFVNADLSLYRLLTIQQTRQTDN